jgi:hypothetical protein
VVPANRRRHPNRVTRASAQPPYTTDNDVWVELPSGQIKRASRLTEEEWLAGGRTRRDLGAPAAT